MFCRRTFCPHRCFVPTDVLSAGCYVAGCFVPPDVLSAGRLVSPSVLSLQMFCPYGLFVQGRFVSRRFVSEHFVWAPMYIYLGIHLHIIKKKPTVVYQDDFNMNATERLQIFIENTCCAKEKSSRYCKTKFNYLF
jgi:hypothetical protein